MAVRPSLLTLALGMSLVSVAPIFGQNPPQPLPNPAGAPPVAHLVEPAKIVGDAPCAPYDSPAPGGCGRTHVIQAAPQRIRIEMPAPEIVIQGLQAPAVAESKHSFLRCGNWFPCHNHRPNAQVMQVPVQSVFTQAAPVVQSMPVFQAASVPVSFQSIQMQAPMVQSMPMLQAAPMPFQFQAAQPFQIQSQAAPQFLVVSQGGVGAQGGQNPCPNNVNAQAGEADKTVAKALDRLSGLVETMSVQNKQLAKVVLNHEERVGTVERTVASLGRVALAAPPAAAALPADIAAIKAFVEAQK